ncbi:MAG TPA: ATP-binding protein, partial [Steroidobacteraceae bacterium]|nr:ATP-binding protein [Steroidobacteraceae bacterium]
EMAARLSALRDTAGGASLAAAASAAPARSPAAALPAAPERSAGPQRRADDLTPTLHALAERLANDHAKRFRLTIAGLGHVPAPYLPTVKDCLIQMLRNAAVHGIEPPDVRRAHTKDDVGAVHVEFRKSADGYELVFEDDGAGIAPEALKAAAVRKGLISEEESSGMDTRTAMALIFRPGFSTQDDVSMDAGRGVGMDVVARSVYALGGKIGVSTHPGRYTRFKIALPDPQAATSTAVA